MKRVCFSDEVQLMDNLVSERDVLCVKTQKTWSNQKLNAHREFLT